MNFLSMVILIAFIADSQARKGKIAARNGFGLDMKSMKENMANMTSNFGFGLDMKSMKEKIAASISSNGENSRANCNNPDSKFCVDNFVETDCSLGWVNMSLWESRFGFIPDLNLRINSSAAIEIPGGFIFPYGLFLIPIVLNGGHFYSVSFGNYGILGYSLILVYSYLHDYGTNLYNSQQTAVDAVSDATSFFFITGYENGKILGDGYGSESPDYFQLDDAHGAEIVKIIGPINSPGVFSPIFFSASKDFLVKIWSLVGNADIHLVEEKVDLLFTLAHTGPVTDMVYNDHTNTLISSSEDTTVVLWNTEDGSKLQTLDASDAKGKQLPALSFPTVMVLTDNYTLAVAYSDSKIRFWNLPTETITQVLAHTSGISALTYSSPFSTIFAGDFDSKVLSINMDNKGNWVVGKSAQLNGVATGLIDHTGEQLEYDFVFAPNVSFVSAYIPTEGVVYWKHHNGTNPICLG